MACDSPLQAFRLADGSVSFAERGEVVGSLELPCGRCTGCRLARSAMWALRCVHEASLHAENCFVTLTYSEAPAGGLNYFDFQMFMRRLRRWARPRRVRFFMCGEYGESFARAHYHAILFGVSFGDRRLWKEGDSGSASYRSAALERLWPHGFSTVGDVSFESAAYVARYSMKKINGALKESGYYRTVDVETGELGGEVCPEFGHMSLKPGIGAGWFDKWRRDVFPHDYVVHQGVKHPVPRYYLTLLERGDPFMAEDVRGRRAVFASDVERMADNSRDRLSVKAQVRDARISFLKREI